METMHSEKGLRAAVISADRFLFQKIKLDLIDVAETYHLADGDTGEYDIYWFDLDTAGGEARGITMSRDKNRQCTLPLPFLIGAARELAEGKTENGLTLSKDERTAVLHGKTIRLTEVEYALLDAIYSRGGEYVSRAELLSEVWGDGTDSGIINVYVHYLREKLESGGEKIIISSRNMGYKIDSKYLGEVKYAENN